MSIELATLTDSLVTRGLGYKGGPLVVVVDASSLEIGHAVSGSALRKDTELAPAVTLIDIDSYRENSILRSLPDGLRHQLEDTLIGPDKEHNTLLYLTESRPGEMPFRKAMNALAAERGRIGGLPSCTQDVLTAAYHPENNPKFPVELFDYIRGIEEVHITCDRGTDLHVRMDHDRYRLVNSNGMLIPGIYANPIPAEVFAHPVDAKGTQVITGCYGPLAHHKRFNGNFAAMVAALDKTPIIWTWENGRIPEGGVYCQDREIQDFVEHEIRDDEPVHGPKMGEIGFPANLFVLRQALTGNLTIDEKGRVHAANGDGYQDRTGCAYKIIPHGDGLLACATCYAPQLGEFFIANNVYNPEIFRTAPQ